MKVIRKRTVKLEKYGTTYRFDEDFEPELFDIMIKQKTFEELNEKGTWRFESKIKDQFKLNELEDDEMSELILELKKYYTPVLTYKTEMRIEYIVKPVKNNEESICLALYGDEQLSVLANTNKLFVKRDENSKELVLVKPSTGEVIYKIETSYQAINYVKVEMIPNCDENVTIEY